mgnify:FL=1
MTLEREAGSSGLSASDHIKSKLGLSSNDAATVPKNAAAGATIGAGEGTSLASRELDDLIKEKRLALMDEQTKLSKARRYEIADRVTRRNSKVRISVPFAVRSFEQPTAYESRSKTGGLMLQGICVTCDRLEVFDEITLRSHRELGHKIV